MNHKERLFLFLPEPRGRGKKPPAPAKPTNEQKPVPLHRKQGGKKAEKADADGFRAPPKHMTKVPPPTGNITPTLPLTNPSLEMADEQPEQSARKPRIQPFFEERLDSKPIHVTIYHSIYEISPIKEQFFITHC
ncbi:hypothetical protein CEXT_121621 [Caerostris extrusa]|uniref:Uncharacterized protein n=1 Tax=Caerostris extrusa TaxID=172846 RepID=A0AAV4RNY9_CAEEX|nr:hypothetical protein CEXT_121621 [Caerostris extrusa]